jgi:threonine/homoserine/homoserine lactone efflux protein
MKLVETVAAVNWTDIGLPSNRFNPNSWEALLTTVTNWVFLIAGIVAFFYLVYSGFTYLTAGGNADNAKKGQQGIINAIIGLVIIFLAFAIVRAVTSLLGDTSVR